MFSRGEKGILFSLFLLANIELSAKRDEMDNLLIKEQIEALDQAGCKFTPGGSHISRTTMLAELKLVLVAVFPGSPPDTYRSTISQASAAFDTSARSS